jgi:reactive intermediate/imine deaminase
MKTNKLLVILGFCVLLSNCQQKAPEVEFLVSESTKKLNRPFSDAVRYGNLLFLSGKVGTVPSTSNLASGGIKGETKQALENIKKVLEENGSSLDNVIKCTVMLADIEEWADMNSVYVQYFTKNKPARSAFGVSGLALGARVELECIAVIK